MSAPDPRVRLAGPLLVAFYSFGWVLALLGLALVTTVLVLTSVVAESGGDAGAALAWAERAQAGDATVLPGWLLVTTLVLQTPAMLALVPLAWWFVDALLFRPRTGASGRTEGWRGVFGLHRASGGALALGLGVGLTVGLVPGWFVHQVSTAFPSLRNGTIGMINGALTEGSLPVRVLLGLMVAVVVPLVEELVFRGFMWDALRRRLGLPGVWVATSLIFCVYHMDPLQSVAIVPTALMLGWLRWTSGSLWPPVILHMANNTLGVTAALYAEGDVDPPITLALFGAACTFGFAALALRGRLARDPSLGDGPLG